MKKKSISSNRKEIQKSIEHKLNNGMARTQVLEELSAAYFDQSTLAKMIAATADNETKAKYRTLNNILLGLLVVTIITKVLIAIDLLMVTSIYALPIILLLPLLNIYLAIGVSKYTGYLYRVISLLTFAGMLQMMEKQEGDSMWLLIDLGIGAAILGLSFYLGNKMFPYYGFFGPKKGEDGNVLLG